ncbi:MAG: glucose 1-dehydrogenase [Candidatus Cryptobacteroides sp.]|nr:glucose 1-dehydrogenase [Rikenellaceae bacterium]MDY5746780.1 glucose 1-dehydrogenase [Candidatus Cryptobacteroides sp.]
MEISLKGKVAVVTGGTRGIGYAIVKKYLEAGASVVLCGSRESTANAALEKIKAEMPDADVSAMAPDLCDSASVEAAFKSVYEKYGRFDILANNAGMSQHTLLTQYTDEEVDKILDVNIKAVFVCARAAARIMKENGGGCIINTSSVVSIYGQPSGCLYPTSKFAVNGLTKSLARELAKYNIRVNAVAPGVTRTDMVANLPDEMIKPLIARIPMGRMCEPEDIANAYLFLSSELASYITGIVVPVDGAVVI